MSSKVFNFESKRSNSWGALVNAPELQTPIQC